MRRKAVLILFYFFWAMTLSGPLFAADRVETADDDHDGKPDRWITRDAKGIIKNTAKDSNHDGKPDQFSLMLKGRELVLKEADRNFDGKIDKRSLTQWDANKKIMTMNNGRPNYIANPGYVTLWKEEDNDFDGKIDVYHERGNKNPSTEKIGKVIDPLPSKPDEKPSPGKPEKKKSQSEALIDSMNERYGQS